MAEDFYTDYYPPQYVLMNVNSCYIKLPQNQCSIHMPEFIRIGTLQMGLEHRV